MRLLFRNIITAYLGGEPVPIRGGKASLKQSEIQ